MHIRYVTSRRGQRTYRYAQLVESYRRPKDGMPATRVIAGLGKLPELVVDNLKLALRAAARGQSVVLPSELLEALSSARVLANYRFLPLLVLLRTWQQLQLDSLLRSVLPHSRARVDVTAVLAALTFHRATEPDSKIAASRWYPKTALAELQGIAPRQFNNTRVHEALRALALAEGPLQKHLPRHLHGQHEGAHALFLDISDTWFEGRGPPQAQMTRTKHKLLRSRIGIALLCDSRGVPLRWKTLPGKFGEAHVMGDMVEEIRALPWLGDRDIVMDRAMGNAATLARLLDLDVRFVTALPFTEFYSWTQAIPWTAFAELDLRASKKTHEQDIERVCAAAAAAGLEPAHPRRRWVLDLGVVSHPSLRRDPPAGDGPMARALRCALSLENERAAEQLSLSEIARRHGMNRQTVHRHHRLIRLSSRVRERILAGEAERLPLVKLGDLVRLDPQEQESAFEELLRQAPPRKVGRAIEASGAGRGSVPLTARLVVTFNPETFLEKRRKDREIRRDLDLFLEDLNRRLRSRHSRRKPGSIEHEVGCQLARSKLRAIFTIDIQDRGGRPRVELHCDEDAWARRQRYHGFNVIVAHPENRLGAAELVELYFAKDVIEKDFQTIKSEVELRPIHHRTDAKVSAHVTLCVLALLVLRTIEQRLRAADLPMKATTALEMLDNVHLNRLQRGDQVVYSITERDEAQEALARALGVSEELRPEKLGALITDRPL